MDEAAFKLSAVVCYGFFRFRNPSSAVAEKPLWFVIVHVEGKDREIFVRYGLLFKAWERYRLEPPKALESLARVEDDYSDAAMKNAPEGCVRGETENLSPSLAN